MRRRGSGARVVARPDPGSPSRSSPQPTAPDPTGPAAPRRPGPRRAARPIDGRAANVAGHEPVGGQPRRSAEMTDAGTTIDAVADTTRQVREHLSSFDDVTLNDDASATLCWGSARVDITVEVFDQDQSIVRVQST